MKFYINKCIKSSRYIFVNFSETLGQDATFWLVKFKTNSALEIVPFTWLINNRTCHYPTSVRSEEERIKKVKAVQPALPKKNYKKYDIVTMHYSGNKCTSNRIVRLYANALTQI